MDGSGEDVILFDLSREEVDCTLEKCLDFLPLFTFEKIRAGRDKRIHKTDAVFSGAASSRRNAVIGFPFIRCSGLDNVKVIFAFACVDIGIAGVFLLGAFVMGFQSARAALLLGEA